jgi:hypothetical protein
MTRRRHLYRTQTRSVLRSVRIPVALVHDTEERAARLGLTFTDLVVDALAVATGQPRYPRVALLSEVAALVRSLYPGNDYPPDVIRRVFQEIQRTPALMQLYKATVSMDGEKYRDENRAAVNQAIGKLVVALFGAEVCGRVDCPTNVELISSYTQLGPPMPF